MGGTMIRKSILFSCECYQRDYTELIQEFSVREREREINGEEVRRNSKMIDGLRRIQINSLNIYLCTSRTTTQTNCYLFNGSYMHKQSILNQWSHTTYSCPIMKTLDTWNTNLIVHRFKIFHNFWGRETKFVREYSNTWFTTKLNFFEIM